MHKSNWSPDGYFLPEYGGDHRLLYLTNTVAQCEYVWEQILTTTMSSFDNVSLSASSQHRLLRHLPSHWSSVPSSLAPQCSPSPYLCHHRPFRGRKHRRCSAYNVCYITYHSCNIFDDIQGSLRPWSTSIVLKLAFSSHKLSQNECSIEREVQFSFGP